MKSDTPPRIKVDLHLKCFIWIQTPSQSDIWLHRYEQFFEVQKQCKTRIFHLSKPVTQNDIDSFPLIMSQMLQFTGLNHFGLKDVFSLDLIILD